MKKILCFSILLLFINCSDTESNSQHSINANKQEIKNSVRTEEPAKIEPKSVKKIQIPTKIVDNPCNSLFPNSKEILAEDYFREIQKILIKSYENPGKYSYISQEGRVTRNGPFSTLIYEDLLEHSKKYKPGNFEIVIFGDVQIDIVDYLEYKNNLCETHQNQKSNGTLRQLIIYVHELVKYRNEWLANKWLTFPYIETGPKVIESPSPKGLEFYTKYITGGGVIIVGGPEVDDGALLQARKSVIYMTSKKPDIREVLKGNEVRISLFTDTAGTLPEYQGSNEPGGFAMMMTDTSMTANANWLCRPGNYDEGGDPVIHELVHTINHVVFEEINEIYFYERIYKIAENSITNGIFDTGYDFGSLAEGEVPDISHTMGEFWAMTVEGYIMDKENFKNPPYDTRDSIKKVDPELYELITRYFPTDDWDFCE
jgi:hypothetical protein